MLRGVVNEMRVALCCAGRAHRIYQGNYGPLTSSWLFLQRTAARDACYRRLQYSRGVVGPRRRGVGCAQLEICVAIELSGVRGTGRPETDSGIVACKPQKVIGGLATLHLHDEAIRS